YPKGNGGVIQPRAPSTAVILSRGDRHHVFLLAVLHVCVLTAIVGETRHCDRRRRRQVERVRCNQVERGPSGDFPRAERIPCGIIRTASPGHIKRSEEHTSELQSRSDLVCR